MAKREGAPRAAPRITKMVFMSAPELIFWRSVTLQELRELKKERYGIRKDRHLLLVSTLSPQLQRK